MTWEEVDLKKTYLDHSNQPERKREKSIGCRCHHEPVRSYESPRPAVSRPWCFPSARGKTLSDATISKLVRENGINGVPHAIARACFRSWCADVNVSREVAEACLAHVVKGVEGAYQRSDLFERRRSVMQKWSDYVTGAPSADVIPLHG